MPKKSPVAAAPPDRSVKAQAALDAMVGAEARLVAKLAKTVAAEQQATDAKIRAVAACRGAGITWDVIALVLGTKQPNAVAKYRPLLEETREVRVRPARGVQTTGGN